MTEEPRTVRATAPFSTEPASGWLPWGLLAPILGLAFVVIPAIGTDGWLRSQGFVDADSDPVGTLGLIAFLFVPFGLTGLIVIGWTRLVERRPLATIGLATPGGGRRLAAGLAIGALMIVAVVAGSWIVGAFAVDRYAPALASPAALGAIAMLLAAFVVQAGVEELLFRGWMLSAIARKFNVPVAVVLSSAIFTLLHFERGQPILVTFNIILFAVFASVWALRAGSIWGVMGWHAGWNWMLAVGFELRVTSLDAGVPALLVELRPAAADWLTGGPQGPEGSIFCALVLGAGIVFVLLRDRLRQARALG